MVCVGEEEKMIGGREKLVATARARAEIQAWFSLPVFCDVRSEQNRYAVSNTRKMLLQHCALSNRDVYLLF
jgi:hypothetical protein